MEPGGSMPRSLGLSNNPYPEPNQPNSLSDTYLFKVYSIYEGGLKSFRTSLRETRNTQPSDRESNRSWCHRQTTSMIKLFWSQPMSPWASGAV